MIKIITSNNSYSISYKGLINKILRRISKIGKWAGSKLAARSVDLTPDYEDERTQIPTR